MTRYSATPRDTSVPPAVPTFPHDAGYSHETHDVFLTELLEDAHLANVDMVKTEGHAASMRQHPSYARVYAFWTQIKLFTLDADHRQEVRLLQRRAHDKYISLYRVTVSLAAVTFLLAGLLVLALGHQ